MPVADGDSLTVRYSSLFSLMADLRGMGASNMLMSQPPKMLRGTLARAAEAFAAAAVPDGKTAEVFSIIKLSGWASDVRHPRPATRGGATVIVEEASNRK